MLLKIVFPKDLAIRQVEANKIAFGPERVDAAVANDWRTTWPGRIRDAVFDRLLVFPK